MCTIVFMETSSFDAKEPLVSRLGNGKNFNSNSAACDYRVDNYTKQFHIYQFRKVHVHYCFCRGIIFWCQRNLLLAALEILIACGNGMPIYHTHFTVQCNQNIMWNVFGWYLHFYSYGFIISTLGISNLYQPIPNN